MRMKILSISLLILVAMMAVAGAEATVIWDGEVDLNEGTFDYIPAENTAESYKWDSLTDLGALQAASDAGGFDFNTSDIHTELGSFYINSINGIANEAPGGYAWSILINDETTWNGLGLNNLNDGDKVTFSYLMWIEETPGEWAPDVENATHMVNIQVNDATVIWDGEVDLNGGTFGYTPAANPSESYNWDSLTDLGALQAASDAGGFDFNTSDIHTEFGSFYINSIDGIANEAPGGYSWSVLINDKAAENGLGLNNLEDGDTVAFCYVKWIEEASGWIPDVENAAHIVNIKVNDATVIWDGEVELDEGTFDYTPAEKPSESYKWDSLTDLGALQAASNAGGFDFNTSDIHNELGSFYINSINGIANEAPGGYSWSILINDETTWNGLGLNNLNDGDKVTFSYLMWIEETPGEWIPDVENASYKVNIDVSVTEDESESVSRNSGRTSSMSVVETVEEDETDSSEETETKYSVLDEENEEETKSVETTDMAIESGADAETTPGFGAVFAVAGFLLSAIFLAKRRM